MTPHDLLVAELKVRSTATGIIDAPTVQWPSDLAEVMSNKPWVYNCAILTTTGLDYLLQECGADPSKLWRQVVTLPGASHQFAIVVCDAGSWWRAFDANGQNDPSPVSDMDPTYTPIICQNIAEAQADYTAWHKGWAYQPVES